MPQDLLKDLETKITQVVISAGLAAQYILSSKFNFTGVTLTCYIVHNRTSLQYSLFKKILKGRKIIVSVIGVN